MNDFYICDPSKYKECPHTLCQAQCIMTTHKEYAKTEWGKPLIAYRENEPLKVQPKWILCNERLPEVGDTYLVTIEYKGDVIGVDVAIYSPVDGYIDNHWDTFNDWIEDNKEYYHVIAWLQMPEPFEEVKHE